MSKYSELSDHEINLEIPLRMGHTDLITIYPAWDWDDCYPVMDALLVMTTGINLKSDGTAMTEINGKQESAGGGHCRAICELYLMAKDAEVRHG